MSKFASRLVDWQRRHGRHGLPWQGTRDPYRIWLSEVMLQQTQVSAVIPYYGRFLDRFPTVQALAAASEQEVLRLWSGLGYYARGRNLHAAAVRVAKEPGGRFPETSAALAELPGVGRSTAAAIAAFAFGERAAILDGNVKRVLARVHGVAGWPGEREVERELWRIAESLLPARDIDTYTQALMDLGATVCTPRPRCEACPAARDCVARREGLTDRIPASRPKAKVPLRRAAWAVLRAGRAVLLVQRPSAGLWGGLWTFPEFASGAAAMRFLKPLSSAKPVAMAPVEHGFTHFRLIATPWRLELERRPRGLDGRWMSIPSALGEAIPVPVRRLLEALR